MDNDALREALNRLEVAVDWYLGRSSFTQTTNLKGLGHSERVRKELYAAHDQAREALAASKPEPQAQAGEPEVVAEVVSVGTNFATVRPYQQLHGGEKFITLQSHREAMAEQHEIEAQLSGQLEATSRACTEKDAALKACVEAIQNYRKPVHLRTVQEEDAAGEALIQAQKALK